jgi:poly(3-hydroxyoctanoate) depolymerase
MEPTDVNVDVRVGPEGADNPVTADTPLRERMLYSHGVDLFVRERGEGRSLLLINGLGGNVDMWGAAEDRLSAFAHTIAFDLPGCGRSPTLRGPVTIARLANVLTHALDELGHDQVDVLGFSLGGLIAQQLARDDPDRVGRLALAATACGWGSMPGSPEALALISLPIRYHSRALYDQTKWLLSPADRELVDRVAELSDARLRHPPSLVGYTAQLLAGVLWSSLAWLATVDVPTLVLHGAGDRLVPPANGVQLARLLPESRLHVVPDEGHLLVFDPAGAALPLLEDFFGSATHESCDAWRSGVTVDDDAIVHAAFARAEGAQPYRALSWAYRRLVELSRTAAA